MAFFGRYVTADQLKTAMDNVHGALRNHDERVNGMDADNKAALREIRASQEAIRATQIKVGLMVLAGLAAAIWELALPHLH